MNIFLGLSKSMTEMHLLVIIYIYKRLHLYQMIVKIYNLTCIQSSSFKS